MAKKQRPGQFNRFNGLWVRDHVDYTPQDHFVDSENTWSSVGGISPRDGTILYSPITNVVRMHLYKPNPPFTGTNIPRKIVLRSNGELIDELLGTVLITDTNWLDFALVNFFGRCYISPHDGRVGLENYNVYLYDGTTFRLAGPGSRPPNAPLAVAAGGGTLETGDYLFYYSWETASGAISPPSPTVVVNTNFFPNAGTVNLSNIEVGPTGTVARWIIGIKVIPYPTTFSGNPLGYPLYFIQRIDDNTTTTASVTYYSENLVNSADYLLTLLERIPAGVGLMDYKGRMVSYGEFEDPSLVRISEIGEPEAFSETSGFLITDPSDSTGVRSAIEFRDTLFFYKRQRGYVTQDNGDTPSSWQVNNMEKAIGTEQYGIANILDAKGASSDGYILASTGAAYYFNGIFQEPELTYKIRDLWATINKAYFHELQAAIDPINKRVYFLVPLGEESTAVTHVIVGDYRNGLDPFSIKWHKWTFPNPPTSLLIFEDFSTGSSQLVTRLANTPKIVTLDIDQPGTDEGAEVTSYFEFPPTRFSDGISHFTHIRVRVTGPTTFDITVYGQDKRITQNGGSLIILTANPGREYVKKINLVSEQCRIKLVTSNMYELTSVILAGQHLWNERPS